MQYFNLKLTNHAENMIRERGLTKDLAWETFNHPDESKKDREGKPLLIKHFQGFSVSIVLIQDRKGKWMIKTIWRDPALPGTIDERKHYRWERYRKAGTWGKLWIMIKQQLGLE